MTFRVTLNDAVAEVCHTHTVTECEVVQNVGDAHTATAIRHRAFSALCGVPPCHWQKRYRPDPLDEKSRSSGTQYQTISLGATVTPRAARETPPDKYPVRNPLSVAAASLLALSLDACFNLTRVVAL